MRRRQWVIASNHDRADARRFARLDGVLDFRAGRIHHPHQANKRQPLLQQRFIDFLRLGRQGTKGYAQHTLPILSQPRVSRVDALAQFVCQRHRLMPSPHLAGQLQQAVYRALGEGHEGCVMSGDVHVVREDVDLVDSGHPLTFGTEGDLGNAWQALVKFRAAKPEMGRSQHQRALGWIPNNAIPVAVQVGQVQYRVVAQGGGHHQQA